MISCPANWQSKITADAALSMSIKRKLCRERIAARAQPLHEANVTVEVFPLTPPGETFGMAFWNHIIHAGDDEESGVQYEEGTDTMYRLQARPGSSTLCLHAWPQEPIGFRELPSKAPPQVSLQRGLPSHMNAPLQLSSYLLERYPVSACQCRS